MRIFHEIIQDNFTISKRYNEGWIAHWHQRPEMVYILDGISEIKVGKTTKTCKAGDVIFFHSGEIHSINDVQDSVMYICTFNPDALYLGLSSMKYINNFISSEMQQKAGIAEEISRCFHAIFREDEVRDSWSEPLTRADVLKIYSLLVRHFERKDSERPQSLAKMQHFQKALIYIEDNYASDITLADVAKYVNYNASYVSSLFVAYTGQNFKTYLDSFRINKAVDMIKHTQHTFSDISWLCGFVNIRTFNNVFRKVTGVTPSEFKHTNI